MNPQTLTDYLNLLTSQYRDKTKINQAVDLLVDPLVRLQELLASLPDEFDVDQAVGVQLDAVGEWVGISRDIDVPITDFYFEWDGTAAEGWDAGTWADDTVTGTTTVSLTDDSYRLAIKLRIASNKSDGSLQGIYDIIEETFDGDLIVLIKDNQDMSVEIKVIGELSTQDQAVIENEMEFLIPMGVLINSYEFVYGPAKLFSFNVQNQYQDGWNLASYVDPP